MLVSLPCIGANFPDQDREDRVEQDQLLLLPRLLLQRAVVTGQHTTSSVVTFILQSCLESQICTIPSLVIYLEVSRFSRRSEARLEEEKSRLQSSFKKKKKTSA